MLAGCATNAYNALVLRHLAAPPNITQMFPNLLLECLEPILAPRFFLTWQQNCHDEWRVGKGLVKLRLIDHSKMFEEPKYKKAKTFVKREVTASMPKKARLIQGNMNEATAYEHPEEYRALAMAMKEEIIIRHGGVEFQFQYTAGLNHDELSDHFTMKWADRGEYFVLDERDGKNWDSTMQEPLLRAAIALYSALGMRAAVAAISRASGVKGRINFRKGLQEAIKYWTQWKRLSGDWDTSVGNTLISMLVVLVTISKLPQHLKPFRVAAYFMGDDYLAIYSFRNAVDKVGLLKALNFGDASMGITPERALFDDPLRIQFISLGLWPTRKGGWQFVPHPAKQMVKLFAAVPKQPVNISDYQTALAEAFWPVYWGWPMMMRFLKYHYTSKTPMRLESYTLKCLTQSVRDVDWALGFTLKYRIPFVATHFDFGLCTFAQHIVVDWMLAFESADPLDRA